MTRFVRPYRNGWRGGGVFRPKALLPPSYRMLASIQHALYSLYNTLFMKPLFQKPLTQPLLSSEPIKSEYNLRKRKEKPTL